MTTQEIEKIHQRASGFINDAEVNNAFEQITLLVNAAGRADMHDELERLRISYSFMLNYLE